MPRFLSLFFLAAVFYLAIAPAPAKAGYCWMTGCEGDVGYIYVPEPQLWLKRKGTLHDVDPNGDYGNRAGYKIADAYWLFTEPGLPKVDAEVTLDVYTPLLFLNEIAEFKETLYEPSIFFDDEAHTVEIDGTYYSRDTTLLMASGTRLRILGYQMIGAPVLDFKALFALVRVVKDGEE